MAAIIARMKFALLVAAVFGLSAAQASAPALDAPLTCTHCTEWDVPQTPFKLFGNSFYVGTSGLTAVLIVGKNGHVLVDGGLPQSAPLIRRNIEALGYRIQDVKLILNSHAHFDHAGGIAALQAWSHAQVAVSAPSAVVLRAGTVGRDDPQYEEPPLRVPAVRELREVREGETLRVGELSLTAHFTPGHTEGSTTWTWQSCEAGRCIHMVYADSLTPVALGDYRFAPVAARFRNSIDKVAKLPCDLIVSPHPEQTDILEKLARASKGTNPFIDASGCRSYAAGAMRALEARLAKEKESGRR
jgi:metallo-beta-lactamase class B